MGFRPRFGPHCMTTVTAEEMDEQWERQSFNFSKVLRTEVRLAGEPLHCIIPCFAYFTSLLCMHSWPCPWASKIVSQKWFTG